MMLDIFIQSVLVLIAVYFGWKMGKGENPISLPKVMRRIVRTEEKENRLIESLQNEKLIR